MNIKTSEAAVKVHFMDEPVSVCFCGGMVVRSSVLQQPMRWLKQAEVYLVGQELLVDLAMVDLLLNRAAGDQAVHSHLLLLPYAPCPLSRLHVRGWVPVWIVQEHPEPTSQRQLRGKVCSLASWVEDKALAHPSVDEKACMAL